MPTKAQINNLNTEDKINQLYLYREEGLYEDQFVTMGQVKDYIEYLQGIRDINISDKKKAKTPEQLTETTKKFLANYSENRAYEIAQANDSNSNCIGQAGLTIAQFSQALDKVFAGETLSVAEGLFFISDKNEVVNKNNLWQVLGMRADLLSPSELPFKIFDKMFTNAYRVGKVFEIDDPTDLSKYKERCFGAHGTKNDSVLSILKHGFISSKDVEATSFAGQMFGQGIYFCRPSQISKTNYYRSRTPSSKPSYIFLAEIGYEVQNNVSSSGGCSNARPGEINFAKGVGAYDRDEIVVSGGEQIKLTHLVEVYAKSN